MVISRICDLLALVIQHTGAYQIVVGILSNSRKFSYCQIWHNTNVDYPTHKKVEMVIKKLMFIS